MVRKILNYRREHFTDEADIHLNEVHNLFNGFSVVWGIVTILLLLFIYHELLHEDREQYAPLIYWYGPGVAVYTLSPLFIYFYRFRLKDPFKLTYVSYVLSTLSLAYIGILAPRDTHFFLFILALVPAAFFIIPFNKLRLLISLLSIHAITTSALIIGHYYFDPILSYPDWVAGNFASVAAFAMLLVFYQVLYLNRNADKNYQKQITKAKRETESAYAAVKAKDERMQHELDYAADIQHSIMPRNHPHGKYYSIYIDMIAYGKVTGDYLDVIALHNRTYFLICDASGHGIPAALVTLVARQAFHDTLMKETEPAQIMDALNRLIYETIQTTDYLTAFLASLAPDGTLVYSSAGHPPAVYLHGKTGTVDFWDAEGTVLGAVGEAPIPFQNRKMQMKTGDRLLVYSDGFTEEKNPAENEVGVRRLGDWASELVQSHGEDFHKAVFSKWQSFLGHNNYRDDITLASIEYTGSS